MFCIGLSNYFLTTLWFEWEEFSRYNLVKNQIYTLSIGVIITPFFILVNHIFILRKGINEVVDNSLKSNHLVTNQTSKELITIHSQYKDGMFKIDIHNLLYIRSSDNYIDICYKNKNSVQHKLVRNTLAAVEKNIDHPALLRCHRSFIINKNYVRSIKRNAGRYKIVIETSNVEIPISRKYKNALLLSLGKEVVIRP
jgi:DNA-binding LytR/AlgR family response regulator